jgi:hypothetical protein
MPWEDVREETTDIPDRAEPELPVESSSIPVSEQESDRVSQDMSNTGEGSWDAVLKNLRPSGSATPTRETAPEPVQSDTVSAGEPSASVLASVSKQEIDPGTIEIPEAARSQALLGATGESVAFPMPWDDVQESTITIPEAHTAVPVVESPVDSSAVLLGEAEPVEASDPNPVVEQGLPLSMTAMPGAEPETSVFSFAQPPDAPPVSEPEVAPEDLPSEQPQAGDDAANEIIEPQSPVYRFAGEVADPVEPAASLSSPEPALSPSVAEEFLPVAREEETVFGLSPESTEFPADADRDQAASQAEPASPVPVSDVGYQMTGSRADQADAPESTIPETVSQFEPELAEAEPVIEEPAPLQTKQHSWQEPVAAAAKTSLVDLPPKQEEPRQPGESIRFIREPHRSPIAEPELPEPAWDHQDMSQRASSVEAAVDVLFESSSHSAQPDTQSYRTQKLPRRKTRFSVKRIGSAVSDFVGSCFSTTRAMVTSLIGLAVLAGLCAGLGIGAVGLIWVIMEEPPSSTYRSMTTSPQRTLGDVSKNG